LDPISRYHFTERPKETWVEVTPVKNDGSDAQSYVFYDRNFEPQEPIPVLKWTALDWPEDANRARIRFWCRPTTRTPGKELSDVLRAGGSIGGVQISAPEPTTVNGQLRIQVVEKHSPQSAIDSLRVGFAADSRVFPLRVIHEFDRRNRRVVHSFYFPPESRTGIADRLSRIDVTLAEEIKRGALQLPTDSGIEVSVGESDDVFSPDATASGE
jgi:hypothetical protein